MKKVAVVGYAQHKILPNAGALNEVELIMPVVHKVFNASLALEAVIISKVQLLHLWKGYLRSKQVLPLKNHTLRWMQLGHSMSLC